MNERRRRDGFAGWWAKYVGSIAFVALVLVSAGGLWAMERERDERAEAVSSILHAGCEGNNLQDRTLGALVAVSLNPPDYRKLSEQLGLSGFDARVLRSFARLQEAQETGSETKQRRVFERELAELEEETDCGAVVHAYEQGEPLE